MSHQVALTSLSKRFHFTPVSALSSKPRSPKAPKLILLFTWMGARVSHAQKYVNGYASIWPSTPIILVQSLPHDFRPLSRFAKEYSTLVTLLAQHDIDLTKEHDGNEVLVAAMSNGGCWGIDALLSALPAGSILRPRALILDSCPGTARYSVTLKAFLIAGKYRLFSKAIAAVVITIYYWVSTILNKTLGRDPLGSLRRATIERVLAERRSYIYSKEDELIMWKDVESHQEEAVKAGQSATLYCFPGSAHVAHLRADEQRYWKVVQDTWDPTTKSETIETSDVVGVQEIEDGGINSSYSAVDSLLDESYVLANASEAETVEPVVEAVKPQQQQSAEEEQKETSVEAQQQASAEESGDLNEDLDPSILGTKEYWENIYRRERSNYAENSEDEGEIWFGEESEDKIVNYLEGNYSREQSQKVVDLGTGNGHLLFKLQEEGFTKWNMTGIDYSEHSIGLARSIAASRGMNSISFVVQDFLDESSSSTKARYDIVLDKGTFDAISLSDQRTSSGQKLNEVYAKSVAKMMKPEAKLVITSCNWTQEELIKRLTADNVLKVHAFFKKPKQQFSFGGKTGSTTSSVCFALK